MHPPHRHRRDLMCRVMPRHLLVSFLFRFARDAGFAHEPRPIVDPRYWHNQMPGVPVVLCIAPNVVWGGRDRGSNDSPGRPARKHWWMALCSLSTGSSSTPDAAAAAMTNSPAATRTSLFESATCLPMRTAAKVASRPTTPTAAETTVATSGCVATHSIPSLPQ